MKLNKKHIGQKVTVHNTFYNETFTGILINLTRYMAIDRSGNVLSTGNKLGDIQGYGIRILIDWKDKRFAIENVYPVIRPMWNHTGIKNIKRYMNH